MITPQLELTGAENRTARPKMKESRSAISQHRTEKMGSAKRVSTVQICENMAHFVNCPYTSPLSSGLLSMKPHLPEISSERETCKPQKGKGGAEGVSLIRTESTPWFQQLRPFNCFAADRMLLGCCAEFASKMTWFNLKCQRSKANSPRQDCTKKCRVVD